MDAEPVLTRRLTLLPVIVLAVASTASTTTAGATTEADRMQCLGRLRRDLGVCIKTTRERCEAEFRGRLPDCFGGPDCPEECVAALERCSEPLHADRDGCRLACQADQKVAMQGCRIAEDRQACRGATRIKGTKCKARCVRRTEEPLRACKNAFSDCLRACARRE